MNDDPYRVLGVERGTPVAEIRRAYRRLVKANHPDSAGPGALPRFLAIQAAYEELVEGKARPRGDGASARGASPPPAWRADPERARATREHWRRRTSRPGGETETGTGTEGGRGTDAGSGRRRGAGGSGGGAGGSARGAGGSARGAGGSARGAPPDADAPPAGAAADGPPRDRSRSSKRSRATPGSTTYDGADREPFDPEWGGASWYGPSSGTYWTINPREYADPRKHGPEYQARARRSPRSVGATASDEGRGQAASGEPTAARRGERTASRPGEPTTSRQGTAGARRADRDVRGPATAGRAGPDRGQDTGPDTRPDTVPGGGPDGGPNSGVRPASVPPRERPNDPARSSAPRAASQRFGEDRADPLRADPLRAAPFRAAPFRGPPPAPSSRPENPGDPGWALALRTPGRLPAALIAWPPLGLGLALLYGELTGCARFSVACADATSPWPWAIQLVTIAFFLLLPAVARIAVLGTYATLIVVTPLTLFLVTGGRAGTDLASRLLVGGLALAWVAGILIALIRLRRERSGSSTQGSPAGPRSEGSPPVP